MRALSATRVRALSAAMVAREAGEGVELLETRLQGPLLIAPERFGDERGFFSETYRQSRFAELGIVDVMVQDNHSRSREGVVRGMHFQIGEGVAKLVRCGRGAIYDVVVDLRRGSPTYGEWEGFQLDEENLHVLYCPIGFAHGFCTLSEIADVLYKQSNYYSPEAERGIAFDDPDVAIAWPLPPERLIISRRDAEAPRLSEIADTLPFEYQGS
jgi:dTDP-4-dehydrorhamnose 3,5-epimerase